MATEMKYTFALSIDDQTGYILLSDKGAKEKADQLIENTPQIKAMKIDVVLEKANEMFLGMANFKGGFTYGILLYKDQPTLPTMETMTKALLKFTMENEDY
jgi:hypothetical protein